MHETLFLGGEKTRLEKDTFWPFQVHQGLLGFLVTPTLPACPVVPYRNFLVANLGQEAGLLSEKGSIPTLIKHSDRLRKEGTRTKCPLWVSPRTHSYSKDSKSSQLLRLEAGSWGAGVGERGGRQAMPGNRGMQKISHVAQSSAGNKTEKITRAQR